jgi:hypothetical protein
VKAQQAQAALVQHYCGCRRQASQLKRQQLKCQKRRNHPHNGKHEVNSNGQKALIMPLSKSPSKAAFRKNIKAEVNAGKPVKQAVAIAYSVKRAASKGKK